MTSKSEESLRSRLQTLQTRLDEAEETLRAWRSGEVDTVVASGPAGSCVYTLKGADTAYRIMVQTMTEGALTVALDGVILFSNEQFATMLGLPLERVIGASIHDFISAEDAASLSALLRGSTANRAEIHLKRASRAALPAQISSNRLAFDGIECLCLIVTDLSQLRESEERYRLLVEGLQDYAILMLDPQGLVTSWTSAAEKIKGYSADEILGKSFECFYTKADIERGRPQEILRLAGRHGHFEEDGWRVRKDGSLFWANVTLAALTDESGALRGFSKVVRDITVRKRIEQDLKESEEQFRLLLECAPDAIVVVNQHGKLALVNAQAGKLFGYQPAELFGQPVETLLPPGHRHAHAAHRFAYSQSPRLRQMGIGVELKGLRKSGEEFPVEVSLSPIHTRRGTWVAAGIRDITERMEAENRLIAERRRAENANRAKSDFLATMSHEIRTPMNAILGMADLLWETELTRTQRDYVSRFRRAGTNLLTLINDILDLAKIESGRFELESVDFSLTELLERTTELMAPRASSTNIELAVHIMLGTPTLLVGDPLRLQQVLNNIVGNAIKFTEKGSVTVNVRLHADKQPGHLQFSVVDTGIGIPANKLAVIFEDFGQAESSTTRRFGGTGLGLGICRRLVNRMGGDVSVDSVLGQGSVFTFDVILALPEKTPPSEKNARFDLSGRRVLVADDNSTNRLILCRACSAWGMTTEEADNAAKAYKLVREASLSHKPFSLVLLDDVMPDSDGFAALKKLLAVDSNLPVVLISSHNEPGSLTRAKALGAAAYVAKPVRRAELRALISNVLRPSVPHHTAAQTPRGPLRILVAEDSEDNRFLLTAYLQSPSYALTFVENGRQALDMFAKRPFDVVLMDVRMPEVDGLTATASIRAFERVHCSPPVPIVALTADALTEDVERSQAAGCNTHLTKPVSKEKLIAVIESFRGAGPAPPAG